MFVGYDNVKNVFARKLEELRTKENLTQTQLADKLGVSRGAISYYENGKRTPDIEFLIAAADHFKVDPMFLLGYSDNKDPDNRDLGLHLTLSDRAIEFMKADETFGMFLSDLIECDYFNDFWSICNGYLQERLWRYYGDVGAKSPYAYITDIDELEEFRLFKVVNVFSQILKILKAKNQHEEIEKLSANEVEAYLKSDKEVLLKKMDEANLFKRSLIDFSDAFSSSDDILESIKNYNHLKDTETEGENGKHHTD